MLQLRDGFLLAVALTGLAAASDLTPLTTGPGNDTEAAWSPDGRRIAFQTDRHGSSDLYLLEVATKATRPLVEGPGESMFPAWSPDSKWIVFSGANFSKTALAGQKDDGYNLYLVSADGGRPRQLTRGHYRDTAPTFLPDGKRIWFSSNRGAPAKSNAVSLYAVSPDGGEPEPMLKREGTDRAAVQASFAPDGSLFAYGCLAGFQDNWRIRLAPARNPQEGYTLTSAQGSFYGPRWSPAGNRLACTGFQVGDPGWGAWVIEAQTGTRCRLDTGPGNSRSPVWHPDGHSLLFENNRTGTYKLYSIPAPTSTALVRPEPAIHAGQVLHYSFAQRPGQLMADTSPQQNAGTILGTPAWREGALGFATPGSAIAVSNAKGFDFGAGPFSVQAVVEVPADCKFGMIAMGQYPGNRLGWQLYVTDDRRAWFNSRSPDLIYRGAHSDEPLPSGRAVTLTGVRDSAGTVRLYVDGTLQQATSQDATYSYGPPVQIRIGSQHDGKSTLAGWIADVTVFARELSASETAAGSLARFWKQSTTRSP